MLGRKISGSLKQSEQGFICTYSFYLQLARDAQRRLSNLLTGQNWAYNNQETNKLMEYLRLKQKNQLPSFQLGDRSKLQVLEKELASCYVQNAQLVATTTSMCGADPVVRMNFDWVSHLEP